MALFRKKSPQIVRKSSKEGTVEERKTVRVKGRKVEVTRVEGRPAPARTPKKERRHQPSGKGGANRGRNGVSTSRTRSRRPVDDEVIVPVETGRKQMLVRVSRGQTQMVIMEGPVLVEHYVAREDSGSVAGNIYLAKVRNVLPGMEAAFLDIGRGRNAVLYAGEVNYDEDVEGPAPRIEQVLKSGQAVMVQVTKDPMGGKGARLTAQVSLPGRFLVLVPNSQVFGISRRLSDDERRRLRAAVKKVRPDEHGIIVRTAAEGASEQDLAADVDRLVKEWKQIEKKSKKVKAPALLYEEPELTVRVVRDLFNAEEFIEIATDSPSIYERVTGYLRDVAPDLLDRVHLHEGPLPVFEQYHIVEQIHKALDRKVWLPSGGYIVIDRTEALTVIDVNTGKHVGKTNLEETVVQTNIEAAQEIARQLRLRDIGGMIVIDFIDMLLEKNKKQIVAGMEEALAQDKTRSQVFDISPLGLLEVTRKRVSAGLLESFSETCPTCEGRGILLTLDV